MPMFSLECMPGRRRAAHIKPRARATVNSWSPSAKRLRRDDDSSFCCSDSGSGGSSSSSGSESEASSESEETSSEGEETSSGAESEVSFKKTPRRNAPRVIVRGRTWADGVEGDRWVWCNHKHESPLTRRVLTPGGHPVPLDNVANHQKFVRDGRPWWYLGFDPVFSATRFCLQASHNKPDVLEQLTGWQHIEALDAKRLTHDDGSTIHPEAADGLAWQNL